MGAFIEGLIAALLQPGIIGLGLVAGLATPHPKALGLSIVVATLLYVLAQMYVINAPSASAYWNVAVIAMVLIATAIWAGIGHFGLKPLTRKAR